MKKKYWIKEETKQKILFENCTDQFICMEKQFKKVTELICNLCLICTVTLFMNLLQIMCTKLLWMKKYCFYYPLLFMYSFIDEDSLQRPLTYLSCHQESTCYTVIYCLTFCLLIQYLQQSINCILQFSIMISTAGVPRGDKSYKKNV